MHLAGSLYSLRPNQPYNFQADLIWCDGTFKVIFMNRVIRLHPKGSLDSDAGKHVQDKSYFPLRQGLPGASLNCGEAMQKTENIWTLGPSIFKT